MKKHLFIAASLLTLFAASCSNEDIVENENNGVIAGKAITLNATINNSPNTRMTYKDDGSSKLEFKWSNSEKFNLYQGTSSTAAEFSKNKEGNTFTGTAPTGGTGTYYAVYGNNISNANGVLTADISSQTGTTAENGITHFMVAETKDLTLTLAFSHKLALLKLNLTLPDSETKVKKVSVSGMHNKATYTLDGGSYTYDDADKGTISATNGNAGFAIGSDHKITAYVAVFPEAVEAKSVSISVVTGKYIYVYTFTSSKTLTAGKVVPVNITMTTGYEYVDLGLPSGTLWATVNVGATNPKDYGDYYAWGETKTKSEYTRNTYLTSMGGAISSWRDYGTDKDPLKDYVSPNAKSIAGTKYDVAHEKWGGTWKMPTKEQIEEMYNSYFCTTEWTSNYNGTGVAGRIITSKMSGYQGNSIFLPAAGCRLNSSLSNEGSWGSYWSATPNSSDAYLAYYLRFYSDTIYWIHSEDRCNGQSVRPVSE